LVTRPLDHLGGRLHLNVRAASGELRVGLLDESNEEVPGLGRNDRIPVTTDEADHLVRWKDDQILDGTRQGRVR